MAIDCTSIALVVRYKPLRGDPAAGMVKDVVPVACVNVRPPFAATAPVIVDAPPTASVVVTLAACAENVDVANKLPVVNSEYELVRAPGIVAVDVTVSVPITARVDVVFTDVRFVTLSVAIVATVITTVAMPARAVPTIAATVLRG